MENAKIKHTANKFAVLDRENEIAKFNCKNKIQEMFHEQDSRNVWLLLKNVNEEAAVL